jgi:hypothetical protein
VIPVGRCRGITKRTWLIGLTAISAKALVALSAPAFTLQDGFWAATTSVCGCFRSVCSSAYGAKPPAGLTAVFVRSSAKAARRCGKAYRPFRSGRRQSALAARPTAYSQRTVRYRRKLWCPQYCSNTLVNPRWPTPSSTASCTAPTRFNYREIPCGKEHEFDSNCPPGDIIQTPASLRAAHWANCFGMGGQFALESVGNFSGMRSDEAFSTIHAEL